MTGMNPCEPPYEIKPIRTINPGLSSGLEKIILKCTQRNPNDRYQSAEELMYALEHYDEIDDLHRKKQKRKLAAFIAALAGSVFFLGTSIWGYFSAEQKKKDNYDYILAHANTVDDYYEAILTDPSRTEAYLGSTDYQGLISFLIKDDVLSAEDHACFNQIKSGLEEVNLSGYSNTVDVMGVLRKENPTGYADICYEIGETYLFYYDIGVEKDKYMAAAFWFQNVMDTRPIAKIYYDISVCLQNIARYARAEQTAKQYEEYESLWSKVIKLNQDVKAYDEDLQIHVWNEIVSMISNNAKEFCEVSSMNDVLSVVDDIKDNSSKITNSFLQKSITTLKENIETTTVKIKSVKSQRE